MRRTALAILLCSALPVWAGSPANGAPRQVDVPRIEEEVIEPDAESSVWESTVRWMEYVRDESSEDVGQVGRYIDSLFAGEDIEDLPNKSYVRLSVKSTASEIEGRRETDADIKLKVDLPNAKRRWKLFFESDNRDSDRLDQKIRGVATGNNAESVGGLRLESDRSKNWLFSTDVGVRSRIPLDPFLRIKARRDWQLDNPWVLTFEHEDWYYHERGFGTESSLDFHRPITEDYYLSITTAAQFQDRYDVIELAQSLTTTHFIDDRQAIAYGIGVLGVNKPSVKTTAYYVSANYQKRIHKDWLFMEISPELLFPRLEGFRPKWSLTIEFKAILTDP